MKSIAVFAIAVACIVGLATAQFSPYYPAQTGGSGFGNGGLLALIGLLVVLFALFNNSSSNNGDTTVIFGNFSGPTGGK
ncbi:hypothetical protein ACF0H5_021730 [Mactra antiquata]